MKTAKSGEIEPSQAEAIGQIGNGPLPEGEVVGVDKIRDLLFGSQMQDYDRRFSMLEERFLQRFREIEAETARKAGLRAIPTCCFAFNSRELSGRSADVHFFLDDD